MLVKLLENAIEPGGKKTPDIFRKGEVKELPEEDAKALIDKGYAEEIAPEEAPKKGKKAKDSEPSGDADQAAA